MRKLLSIVAALVSLLALQSGAMDMAVAQNMDMAVAQKWASAKVVKYRVEGVHNGREAVVYGDYEGKAYVIDRITVEFLVGHQEAQDHRVGNGDRREVRAQQHQV